jgi:ADP-ribosylglycohydrolase
VSPEEAGRNGDTNGAAMRIAPVGIMLPPEPVDALVAKVAETCRATHNTSTAIASASAVAAAISCGIAGADWRQASARAIEAARRGTGPGDAGDASDMAERIAWAQDAVRGRSQDDAIARIAGEVGTSVASRESVPAAFAVLEVAAGDPWRAAVIGANIGGDTDTIGAMAAGMAGACAGLGALPQARIAELKGIDVGDVRRLAADLVRARLARAGGEAVA